MRALVDLTLRLLPQLKERGGAVVNIASTAANTLPWRLMGRRRLLCCTGLWP